MNIDLSGLEGKWTRKSLDHPPCAACGLRIGSEEQDEGGEGADIPLRMWRGEGDAMEELTLCGTCAKARMYRDQPDRN